MGAIIGCIVGFFIGGVFGMIMAAAIFAGRGRDDDEEI